MYTRSLRTHGSPATRRRAAGGAPEAPCGARPTTPHAAAGLLTAGCALAALATAAHAQGDHAQEDRAELERRLERLEERHRAETDALRGEIRALQRRPAEAAAGQDDATDAAQQRRGLGASGQTSIFDNVFNPAISFSADFVLALSDQDDSFDTLNRFLLRSAELGIAGRVDSLAAYQVYVHFDEEEIELEEAFALADDWLPDTFRLKAGRYNVDFGKLSAVHEHDLPFLDKPGVLQEFVGGSLRGTGAELHHDFAAGDSTLVRWSLGVVNSLDGDAHAVFGPAAGHEDDAGGPEPFGKRDLESFAFTGRLTGLLEVGGDGLLQLGASAAHAPEVKTFFDAGSSIISADLKKEIYGVDVTFKSLDEVTGSGLTLAGELLHTRNDVSDDGVTVTGVESNGFYAYAEYLLDQHWSAGGSGGWYEHADDAAEESWDAGAFVTWKVNEFNRLRIEGRHFDDPDGETSFGLVVQWTIILGSHGHGVDW